MQLVNQAVGQELVPQCAAAEHQDVVAGLALERSDLVVGVRAVVMRVLLRQGSVSPGTRLSDATAATDASTGCC